ncbi:hypothetical protein CTI12_AA217300 [Artemisia annua]|uniref:Reverse transcriptase zinc-binding domain-containing protein n=1 Tax=Artemisia annua TaxID=35608 RepID=A0A2U1NX73_ARTAN|nr:hypothetical protein CTI12_AA217300 [Artemisia annua]
MACGMTYIDMHINGDIAGWHKLMWFSQNIPKHAFILWLAVQKKLPTQDNIRKWGNYDLMKSKNESVRDL